MNSSPHSLYRYHVENLRAIDVALKKIALSLRRAIAVDNQKEIYAFTQVYALLLGAWAEVRLNKLLYEPNGFNDDERRQISQCNTLLERWEQTVEIAFRKQFGVIKAPLSEKTLPYTAYARFQAIMQMLGQDLRAVIELRNRLAHGQFMYAFNSEGSNISQIHTGMLRQANLLGLQFKKKLLSQLADIIHDLVVSLPTFERDFDVHYKAIVQTRQNLRTRDYNAWAQQLREKYLRGLEKRQILKIKEISG